MKMTRQNLEAMLFEAMRHDMCVMAEWEDNENALNEELQNADDEILAEYADTFLA